MHVYLGVDEAGYGPNLGPLVIAATAWTSHRSLMCDNWLSSLEPGFVSLSKNWRAGPIEIGDSKTLFSSGQTLARLERTLSYFASKLGLSIDHHDDILASCDAVFNATLRETPWLNYEGERDVIAPEPATQEATTKSADATLRREGLSFEKLQMRILSELQFNTGVERYGNKASLLTRESLKLAATTLDGLLRRHEVDGTEGKVAGVTICFDKHGGRSKYLAALAEQWPELFFVVECEGQMESSYHAKGSQWPMTIKFLAKGDRLVPCGLASMFAKWTREVLMARFNGFWQQQVPGILPTAGYPVDAARFASEIEARAQKLGFVRDQWWRKV